MEKVKRNIPNLITLSRLIISIIAPIVFITGDCIVALILYIYGAISDFLDGYIVRKYNYYTDLGRRLDAISDKFFVMSLILPAIIKGNYLMIILLILESVIVLINIYAKSKDCEAITERIGKVKTCFLFPTVILGLIAVIQEVIIYSFVIFLIPTVILEIKTIESYINQFKNNMKKKKANKLESALERNIKANTIIKEKESNLTKKEKLKSIEEEIMSNVIIDRKIKNKK